MQEVASYSRLQLIFIFHLGPVQTYPEICENAIFFTNSACVHMYSAYFLAVFGNFWKRSPEWTFFDPIRMRIRVDACIRKFSNMRRHFLGSSLSLLVQANVEYRKVVASLLVALISFLISCVQITAAVINLQKFLFPCFLYLPRIAFSFEVNTDFVNSSFLCGKPFPIDAAS